MSLSFVDVRNPKVPTLSFRFCSSRRRTKSRSCARSYRLDLMLRLGEDLSTIDLLAKARKRGFFKTIMLSLYIFLKGCTITHIYHIIII